MKNSPGCTDIYNEIDKLGIEVSSFPLRERKAFIGPEGYLAIDYARIATEAEERAVLLEEIGHFCTNAFYTPATTRIFWEKQENRAHRFVFEKYYPPESIAALMAEGCFEPWDLAEALGLPERFVREMLQFYAEVRRVDFNTLAEAQRVQTAPPPRQAPPIASAPPPAAAPPVPARRPLPTREQRAILYWAAFHLDELELRLESGPPPPNTDAPEDALARHRELRRYQDELETRPPHTP